jgi:hypothetical protein
VTRRSPTGRLLAFLVTGLLSAPVVLATDIDLRSGCAAHFATDTEAAQVLGQKDDFIERLSPFDRSARVKTDQPVPEDRFLTFIKSNVSVWTDTEKTKVQNAITAIRPALEKVSVNFPKQVLFIKTTGAEEGNAFYTRDTAIVMPGAAVDKASPDLLKKTIAHELFHILSRTNPDVKEKLYQTIGFNRCDEIELPPDLAARKITNPDAPRNDHAIKLQFGGKEVSAVPILLAKSDRYDRARGGEFFDYMQLKFLVIQPKANGKPELIDPAYVSHFFEQIGRNTDYVIHPEEILADNFALLVIGGEPPRSPQIVEKMRELIETK